MKKIVAFLSILGVLSSVYGVNLAACKGCHGQNWEKKALGKSKVVKDLNESAIVEALTGYKTGTYGGPMKGIMKGQVAKFSEDKIIEIASSINK